jgi:hypothetical protein
MIAYKTMACWSDLLGFGAQLNESHWRLNEEAAELAGMRLSRFASMIYEMAASYEQGSFINDALIRTLDNGYYLTPANKWVVRTWLDSCIMAHCMTALEEAHDGLPGIRTIICEGEVLKYELQKESHFRQPFQSQSAIPTQLNTALSKCYIADSKGSRELGLKKGSIYIEQSIIDHLIQVFEYKQVGAYLFTYAYAVLLEDVTLYDSIKELYFIADTDIRDEAEQGFHRSPWFKLGEKKMVVEKNLRFELVEILAYSPLCEFSLCWHDCFTGVAAGVSCSVVPELVDDFKKKTKNWEEENPIFKFIEQKLRKKEQELTNYVEPGTTGYQLLMQILQTETPADHQQD